MGKSVYVKYILIITDQRTTTREAWDNSRRWGKRPTDKNLAEYIQKHIDSLKVGGMNAHISAAVGFMPIPHKARIENQMTGEVMARWEAPSFMVI